MYACTNSPYTSRHPLTLPFSYSYAILKSNPQHSRASEHSNRESTTPASSQSLRAITKRRQSQNDGGESMGERRPSIPLTKIKFATICLTERKLCSGGSLSLSRPPRSRYTPPDLFARRYRSAYLAGTICKTWPRQRVVTPP